MLADLIQAKKNRGAGLVDSRSTATWDELLTSAARFKSEHPYLRGARAAISANSPDVILMLLIAFSDLDAHITLLTGSLPPGMDTAHPVDVCVHETIDRRVEIQRYQNAQSSTSVPGGSLTIFSSGTTGNPRPHEWSWLALRERMSLPEHVYGGTWLSAYPLATFAGIQALLYACAGADTLILVDPSETSFSRQCREKHLNLAMATPTFWRRSLLLGADNLKGITIDTISMGGEPASQDLLDHLRNAFQCQRLVHVYASSEHGSLFSVSDGYAGFPTSWLNRRLKTGVALEVRDNQLYVSLSPGSEYRPTGDLVRVCDGRTYFDGRVTEQINVGGMKVSPLRIETSLRSIEGILDARVYAIPNAITGQVVAADLVLQADCEKSLIEKRVRSYFREHHRTHERPLKLTLVNSIAPTCAGKVVRR